MEQRMSGEIDRHIGAIDTMLAEEDMIATARFTRRLAGATRRIRHATEVRIEELKGKNWFARWWGDLKGERSFRDNIAASEFVFSGLARILNDEISKKGGVKNE